jgi:hypothetical protein
VTYASCGIELLGGGKIGVTGLVVEGKWENYFSVIANARVWPALVERSTLKPALSRWVPVNID